MGLVGLFLLLAAVEVVWAHQLTLEPETDDNGTLTVRGGKRRNQDLIVGTAFLVAGVGLVVIALGGLINPRAVVEVDDRTLRLRIAGPQRSLSIDWDDVLEVRSAREPGDGVRSRPLLLILLREPEAWPEEYWGARRDGPWLIVDAESWTKPPDEVVVHARLALESRQRAVAALPDDAV
jgi:hypothetical protein